MGESQLNTLKTMFAEKQRLVHDLEAYGAGGGGAAAAAVPEEAVAASDAPPAEEAEAAAEKTSGGLTCFTFKSHTKQFCQIILHLLILFIVFRICQLTVIYYTVILCHAVELYVLLMSVTRLNHNIQIHA